MVCVEAYAPTHTIFRDFLVRPEQIPSFINIGYLRSSVHPAQTRRGIPAKLRQNIPALLRQDIPAKLRQDIPAKLRREVPWQAWKIIVPVGIKL
jgi:hypothetical protein